MVRRLGFLIPLIVVPGCGGEKSPVPTARPVPVTRPTPTISMAKPVVPTFHHRIEPASWVLAAGDDGVQLVAVDAPDVTWRAEPPGIVSVDDGGYVRPRAPGVSKVKAITTAGESAEATITVGSGIETAWDFAEDVVPVLTRAGCNAGGCHGKADGQNGFHLSLSGYDPAGDFQAITREPSGGGSIGSNRAEA